MAAKQYLRHYVQFVELTGVPQLMGANLSYCTTSRTQAHITLQTRLENSMSLTRMSVRLSVRATSWTVHRSHHRRAWRHDVRRAMSAYTSVAGRISWKSPNTPQIKILSISIVLLQFSFEKFKQDQPMSIVIMSSEVSSFGAMIAATFLTWTQQWN